MSRTRSTEEIFQELDRRVKLATREGKLLGSTIAERLRQGPAIVERLRQTRHERFEASHEAFIDEIKRKDANAQR